MDTPAAAPLAVSVTATEVTRQTVSRVLMEENLAKLEAGLARFNRKAARLGVAPATIIVDDKPVVVVGHSGDEMVVEAKLVTVEYDVVKVAGNWKIIGTLEASMVPGETLVNLAPGVQGDWSAFHHHDMHCDHCKTSRVRNDVVLVEDRNTGEVYSVGRNCTAEFLGVNPESLLAWADVLGLVGDKDDDLKEYAQAYGKSFSLAQEIIGYTLAVVAVDGGFVSAKSESNSTSSKVGFLMQRGGHPREQEARQFDAVKYGVDGGLNEDQQAAAAAMADRLVAQEGQSEFARKVSLLVRGQYVTGKHFSTLVAGAGVLAGREIKAAAEAKAPKPVRLDQHMGQEGDKITFTGTVDRTLELNGQWGPSTLVAGRDAEGRAWKTFTKNAKDFVVGETYKLAATVKRHEEDVKWGKSTVLLRVKLAK